MAETTSAPTAAPTRWFPDMPLVIWMVLISMVLAFGGGMQADAFISTFNTGFGRALGEFALILLPSFALAAALSHRNVASAAAERAATLGAPLAGAGMICPDTAYAALAPAAGRRKLDVAFGAYAGFKLLYPAGPLLVVTGLGAAGGDTPAGTLVLFGIALTLPLWAAGVIWARMINAGGTAARGTQTIAPKSDGSRADGTTANLLRSFASFVVLTVLLGCGALWGTTSVPILDFLFRPKGALLAAAVLALLQIPAQARRGCFDSAVRRTASLLLVIGAASAFGAVLTHLVPMGDLVPQGSGMLALLGLFMLTVVFKLAQGSSMATFAAVAPVAAPVVLASGLAPVAAVFAICLGSFIAILPNDSYYWLVRRDALEHEESDMRAIWILTGGAVVQAALGLVLVMLGVWIWT